MTINGINIGVSLKRAPLYSIGDRVYHKSINADGIVVGIVSTELMIRLGHFDNLRVSRYYKDHSSWDEEYCYYVLTEDFERAILDDHPHIAPLTTHQIMTHQSSPQSKFSIAPEFMLESRCESQLCCGEF